MTISRPRTEMDYRCPICQVQRRVRYLGHRVSLNQVHVFHYYHCGVCGTNVNIEREKCFTPPRTEKIRKPELARLLE